MKTAQEIFALYNKKEIESIEKLVLEAMKNGESQAELDNYTFERHQDEIESAGYDVKDTSDGVTLSWKV